MKDSSKDTFSPILSLVIPAFNEEDLLESTLIRLVDFLKTRFKSFEIIVVDDGSMDETIHVVDRLSGLQTKAYRIRLLQNETNMGKGYSVKQGMLVSRGKYVFFTDADLPYDPEAIVRMVEILGKDHSLAIGARVLKGEEKRAIPPVRFFAGQTFSVLVRLFTVPGIRDTQCGLKGFTAEAAQQISKRLTINDFGFDVEILYIARKFRYSICPVVVRMTGHRYDSRVHVLRDSMRMLLDLFIIRINDLRGLYEINPG